MAVKRILLVEDQVNVAVTLARGLQLGLGKDTWVDTCHSAEAALHFFHLKPYDLLITDQNLPGLSGLGLITSLKQSFPHLITLVITGSPTEQLEVSARELSTPVIPKPFQLPSFISLVRDLL
jgi:DNA-binding response OmpR family regulator